MVYNRNKQGRIESITKGDNMKIEIKSRFNHKVLFVYDCDDNIVAVTIAEAIKAGASLRGADLYGVDLRYADLYGADLNGANLRGANLYGADLRDNKRS